MEWIDPKLLEDALKIQLNKLYGGIVCINIVYMCMQVKHIYTRTHIA